MMTDIQKCMMELLDEIVEICEKKQLTYILSEKTAGRASKYGCFKTGACEFNLAMTIPDILELKKYMKEHPKENREIEDLSNNSELGQNIFRYVNTASLLLDIENPVTYKKNGIAITIKPLWLQEPSSQIQMLEKAMNYIYAIKIYNYDTLPKDIKKAILKVRFYNKVFGKQYVANKIYKHLEEQAVLSVDTKVYFNNFINIQDTKKSSIIALSSSIVRKTKEIKFEGKMLKIPNSDEAYFKKIFGKSWSKVSITPTITANRIAVISDPYMPYAEYFAQLEEQGISMQDLLHENTEYYDWYCTKLKSWEGITYHKYQYARRAIDRIDLYCMYEEKIEELRLADEVDDMKKLAELMKPYMERTKHYKKTNLGFYINKELFDFAQKVWIYQKKPNYAAEILKIVPGEYIEEEVGTYLKKRGYQ